MNCRKARKEIPFYLAPHESWLKPNVRATLKAHLAVCEPCRQECEETRKFVESLRKHCPISEDTKALLDNADCRERGSNLQKIQGTVRLPLRVAAVAALIVICVGIGLALLPGQDYQRRASLAQKDTPRQERTPEITITENGVSVPSSGFLTTGGDQIREFWINGRHRLVMNRDTVLSMAPLVENDKLGYLVSLRAGQILAQVEHDGNPFEVRSLHGKAVITGTTFDVKVSEHETTLVVAEGSVRFASEKGAVQVNGGFRSTTTAQSRPAEPIACDSGVLLAWAGGQGVGPEMVEISSDSSAELFEELIAFTPDPGGPIDLDSLDYDEWVEGERSWFKSQFPWIFDLQKAIRAKYQTQGHEAPVPGYPELLLQTGDIWQIVYPERVYRKIAVVRAKSLSVLAVEYGLDDTWPRQAIASINGRHSPQPGMTFGVASLERWLAECRDIQSVCESGEENSALFEYSQAMAEYLEHTRTLAWLCVRNGQLPIGTEHRKNVLHLLLEQVVGAHAIEAASRHAQFFERGSSTLETCRREVVEGIAEIVECEWGVREALGVSVIKC